MLVSRYVLDTIYYNYFPLSGLRDVKACPAGTAMIHYFTIVLSCLIEYRISRVEVSLLAMADLNLYLLTFNCARNLIEVERFANHLFDALHESAADGTSLNDAPELIVLSLQEIAPIAYAFLGGSFLTPYFDAFHQALERAASRRWGVRFASTLKEHCGMTALMVFARPDIADAICRYEVARVGLGLEQMGNKAAVAARLHLTTDGDQANETVDFTFVAAHLAPSERAFERRNKDWRGMVERLVFTENGHLGGEAFEAGEESDSEPDASTSLLRRSALPGTGEVYTGIFTPNTHLFLAGDLNYRTSDISPPKGGYAQFPQPTADPESPRHFSQLLKHDQLAREMRRGRCFQEFCEAPITFPPTYKYSHAARQAMLDNKASAMSEEWRWTSYRWPSWCDRVLYLDTPSWMQSLKPVRAHAYESLPLMSTSDHRPVALSVSVPFVPIRAPEPGDRAVGARIDPPFSIDPDWERKRTVARRKEVAVGCLAYLGLTREGNGLLLATALTALGAWLVWRSLLEN